MPESVAVQRFLAEFADTFNQQQSNLATEFCSLPSIIIDDHNKKILNDRSELMLWFERIFARVNAAGITRLEPTVNRIMRLSDTLIFTNARWQLFDENQQPAVSIASSFTLQKMLNGAFKIMITVIDDENQQLHHYLQHAKEC